MALFLAVWNFVMNNTNVKLNIQGVFIVTIKLLFVKYGGG